MTDGKRYWFNSEIIVLTLYQPQYRMKVQGIFLNSEVILIAGKALIWFAIPLGLAVWELWRLNKDE